MFHVYYLILLSLALLASPAFADADQKKAGTIVPVDLSSFYQQIWSDLYAQQLWASVPRGLQVLGGVPFQIGGTLELTGMQSARSRNSRPTRVTGIPVGRKASRIYLLHGTGGTVADGTPVAKVELHYANGERLSFRILYGTHVRNWWADRWEQNHEAADPHSEIVWTGTSEESDNSDTTLRLFSTPFLNPMPEVEIKTLDLVSFFSEATYALVAISLETSSPMPGRDSSPAVAVPESDETAWRKVMLIRLVDAIDGKPVAGAVLNATARDPRATIPWGSYTSDTEGRIEIDYPPTQLTQFQFQVGGHNHLPARVTCPATPAFPAEFPITLQRGAKIGGLVRDAAAHPVADARVIVSGVVRDQTGEFYLAECAPLLTDPDGRWAASCVLTNFSKLTFSLSHSNFITTEYDQAPSENGNPYVVSAEDLLAGRATMELSAGVTVEGMVTEQAGKPVANAQVTIALGTRAYAPRKTTATDRDGRFYFGALEPGDGFLLVAAKGFAPQLTELKIDPNLQPQRVTLKQGMVLRGRVTDQEGKPVKGVSIAARSWNGRPWLNWRTETDEEGRFAWDSAPEGPVRYSATRQGFNTLRNWELSAGGEEVNLTLAQIATVSGTVIDAETREPIRRFSVIEGNSLGPGEQIHWERQGGRVGFNGHFSFRLQRPSDWASKVLIEAEGYLPTTSPLFTNSGAFTLELKRGKGISGVVALPSGEPASGATVVLVGSSEGAYMDKPGEFRADIYQSSKTVTDAAGRFQFTPRLDSHTIFATHEKGYAEIKAEDVSASGKIRLQAWGRVKGVLRVGTRVETNQTVALHNVGWRYGAGDRQFPALGLYLNTRPEADGTFVFERVPPGERKIHLQYHFSAGPGPIPLSHGFHIIVKPGETAEVTIGGTGRSVTGRIAATGDEAKVVDWRRDVHTLVLKLHGNPDDERPDRKQFTSEAGRRTAWEEYARRAREFWTSEAGHHLERAQRTYVLVFRADGSFRVDHVPPGAYRLTVTPTEPGAQPWERRSLGALTKEIIVPEGTGPFDLGILDLEIRRIPRPGGSMPDGGR